MALSSLYITLTPHMYKIKPNHSLTPTFFIKFPPFSHSIYFTIKYIMECITKLASQKAVVIFSKSSCGMSHAIKRLFYEQGVGPAIYELDEDIRGKEMEWALMRLGCNPSVPAVFVGGNFVGSANTVMTLHLNGSLKKMLRDAGALWL